MTAEIFIVGLVCIVIVAVGAVCYVSGYCAGKDDR